MRCLIIYTGREWDKETGLYYYRARYYDPIEGRFISKDPIGFAGGDVNVYGYVGNNAINRTDSTGLAADTFPIEIEIPKVCSAAFARLAGVLGLAGTISGSVPACDDDGEPKGCRDDKQCTPPRGDNVL